MGKKKTKNEEGKIAKTRNTKRGEQNEKTPFFFFRMTSRGTPQVYSGTLVMKTLRKRSMAYGRRAAFGAVGP